MFGVSRYGGASDVSQFLGISTLNSYPTKTYKTCGEIALAFAQNVQAQVQADARVAAGNNSLTTTLSGITTTDVQPPTGQTFGQNGDRILQFKITCSIPHTLTSVKIECLENLGESWALLGGDRIYDQPIVGGAPGQFGPVTLGQNSLITSVSSTEIIVSGRYPMQRSTSPQIYLRCDLPNDNIETSSLNRVGLTSDRISDRSGATNANVFHAVPTDDNEWQRLDLWSITTGNNDIYDYVLSDPNVYEVLRHGLAKIKKKGYYRVTCELGLDIFTNEPGNRYNIAIQFAKKTAQSTTFTRHGVPVMSGYMNYHGGSGAEALKSMHISSIFEFDPEEEIAIFTTRMGEFGYVHAIKKLCMLRIESLN